MTDKGVVVAIEFEDKFSFESSVFIALHRYNVVDENLDHCIKRERGKEVLTCRNLGVPYIVYIKPKNKNKKFSVVESNFNIDKLDKSKYALFVRKCSSVYPDNLGFDYIQDKGLSQHVKYWVDTLSDRELGRSARSYTQKQFAKMLTNNEFKFPVFIKTVEKGSHGNTLAEVFDKENIGSLMLTEDRLDLNDDSITMRRYLSKDPSSFITLKKPESRYYNEWIGEYEVIPESLKSLDGDVMVSDVLSIKSDQDGTKEYRSFIVNGVVTSTSRYLDYKDEKTPDSVVKFAYEFAEKYKSKLPLIYVADFAETEDGIALVELNPFENSGRYNMNSPIDLYTAIMDLSKLSGSITINNIGLYIPDDKLDLEGSLLLSLDDCDEQVFFVDD